MKKIKIFAMGGTISARGHNRLDLKDYQSGVFTGKDFLKHMPELQEIAHIDIEQIDNVSSTAINTKHWFTLRNKINQSLTEEGYDGIVITHGTNTLEETAYFLHLTIPSEKPVVLVGAQRPFSAVSSDAQLNLINAVRVAADDNSSGKGVLVVLNDEISCAREVTKTNTYRLETFQSGQLGFLGFVEPDYTIQYYRTPTRKHTIHSRFSNLALDALDQMPNAEIIYSYAGATGELIRHISSCGKYQGIVMAGTGAGRFSPDEDAALYEAVNKGICIVQCSRVGSGRVASIEHYKRLRAVRGDNLLPQKARILLMLSLLIYNNATEIQSVFDEY